MNALEVNRRILMQASAYSPIVAVGLGVTKTDEEGIKQREKGVQALLRKPEVRYSIADHARIAAAISIQCGLQVWGTRRKAFGRVSRESVNA